jgi:hypothetical protein
MKQLETEITINAAPSAVWKVLMDFKAYGEWNPFVVSIKGKADVAAYLKTSIKMEGKKPMDFEPEVLVVRTNQEFRWKGKMFVKGLFDGEHYFILEEKEDGRTELIHGELFTGILAGLILKMIKEDTLKGFESMNEALKIRVESAT